MPPKKKMRLAPRKSYEIKPTKEDTVSFRSVLNELQKERVLEGKRNLAILWCCDQYQHVDNLHCSDWQTLQTMFRMEGWEVVILLNKEVREVKAKLEEHTRNFVHDAEKEGKQPGAICFYFYGHGQLLGSTGETFMIPPSYEPGQYTSTFGYVGGFKNLDRKEQVHARRLLNKEANDLERQCLSVINVLEALNFSAEAASAVLKWLIIDCCRTTIAENQKLNPKNYDVHVGDEKTLILFSCKPGCPSFYDNGKSIAPGRAVDRVYKKDNGQIFVSFHPVEQLMTEDNIQNCSEYMKHIRSRRDFQMILSDMDEDEKRLLKARLTHKTLREKRSDFVKYLVKGMKSRPNGRIVDIVNAVLYACYLQGNEAEAIYSEYFDNIWITNDTNKES